MLNQKSIPLSLAFLIFYSSFLWAGELNRLERKVSRSLVSIKIEWPLQEELKNLRQGKIYQGIGTGVIISEDGLILTSAAVIPDSKHRVRVTLVNGKTLRGRVLAVDKKNGVALLKAQGKFTPLKLAESRKAKAGDPVVTLGNVYGSMVRNYRASLSLGTISSRYIVLHGQGEYQGEALETTAAVNPGIFGGALVNLKGELLGILLPTVSKKKWLGVAVPIHQIKKALPFMKKGQKVPRGILGLALVQKGEWKGPRRIEVDKVLPASPAASAGLRPGDILERVESRPLTMLSQLDVILPHLPPGSRLEFVIRRKNKRKVVLVELASPREVDLKRLSKAPSKKKEKEKPSKEKSSQKDSESHTRPSREREKTPGEKKEGPRRGYLGMILGKKMVGRGVVIKGFVRPSPVAKELQPGDLITAVNSQSISSRSQLTSLFKDLVPGESLTLLLRRGRWKKRVKLMAWSRDKIGRQRQYFPSSWKEWGLVLTKGKSPRVRAVVPNSQADYFRIKAGDRLSQVGNDKWKELDQFTSGTAVVLSLEREGWEKKMLVYIP